jgi:hypothetical protein
MNDEDLGWRFVAQAFACLVIEVAAEIDQNTLRNAGKIGIAWHEAANALVGVFHRAFLLRRTGIAELAARADAIFQSPDPANSVPRSKVKL